MVKVSDVVDVIKDILEDNTLPKNIKAKLDSISTTLQKADGKSVKLKVDKCVHELEEVSSDVNIEPFARTQIWSVVSMLESLED